MRAQLYEWLSSDTVLSGLVGDRIYPVHMQDTKPDTPYIVYRLNTANPRVVPAKNQNFQVWAHDNRGTYLVIDEILQRVKEVLVAKPPSGDFYQVEWLDDSNDLYDDAASTLTRFSRYVMILRD